MHFDISSTHRLPAAQLLLLFHNSVRAPPGGDGSATGQNDGLTTELFK